MISTSRLLPLTVKNEDPCRQYKNNKGNADSGEESCRKGCLVTNVTLICCDTGTIDDLKGRKQMLNLKETSFVLKGEPVPPLALALLCEKEKKGGQLLVL